MNRPSFFVRMFPPPKFLAVPYAGLEVSDDALRMIEYAETARGLRIAKCDRQDMPDGLMEGGDIKDEAKFTETLGAFAAKNKLSRAKVSLPEEKTYLFQTAVPSTDPAEIYQNIEFQIESNVPLSAADAVFDFRILPPGANGGSVHASVSVVPRAYLEKFIANLRSAGITVVGFEVAPSSIARSAVPVRMDAAHIVIHTMNHKTGIYIISGAAVCFSSTIAGGADKGGDYPAMIIREINRAVEYWTTRPDNKLGISGVLISGRGAVELSSIIRPADLSGVPEVSAANAWHNIFDLNEYIPPISGEDALEYAVVAGLALQLS